MKEVQQAEALRLADELVEPIDGFQEPTILEASAAAELRRQHARIAELEAELEAVGAGGVGPLRKQAAAPQAVQDAVPLFWVRLLRDGLYEGPVHNNSVGGKMLRDEKPGEWHPLYLHTAPAHPAEGVPAQGGTPGPWRVRKRTNDVGGVLDCFVTAPDCQGRAYDAHILGDDYDSIDLKLADAELVVAAVNAFRATATHPTQQGLADLRWQIVHDHISGEYIAGRACFVVQIPTLPGANIMRGSVAEHFTKAVDALAAQAKQGE